MCYMPDAAHSLEELSAVPLFPLPSVVLFPRAVLPLHIFEERYKQMMADALRGPRLIAMALLKPGWEKDYYQRPAIDPIVCVGSILTYEKLPDGKYNLLLQGTCRARLARELQHETPYRLAELTRLEERPAPTSELAEERRRLISIFEHGTLLATGIGRQFHQLLSTPLPTADIADLVAFKFLDDVRLQQSLLSECDVLLRVRRIIEAFETHRPALEPVAATIAKPSMN